MSFRSSIVAYLTVLFFELRRTLRLSVQTILPPAITTTLYFLIFGHLIGQRIGSMAGIPYIDFIVPGLIMMSILTSAFSASVSVVYMQKWTNVVDEMLVSPMSSLNILLSYMSVGLLRATIVTIVVSIVALLFTHVEIKHVFYAIFVALLAASIFSLMGVINGLLARSFDQISIMPTFIIAPLSYLGGVFYSLTILPAFWQKVALVNPVVYIISTFRFGFFGWKDTNIIHSTIVMIAIFLVLLVIGYAMIKKRIGISD